MERILIISLIVVSLTGCATAAQQQAETIKAVIQQAVIDERSCLESVIDKPEYASIISHLPSPEQKSKPTMAQLADDAFPTKNQSKLLILAHDEVTPCKEEALNKLENIWSSLATVAADEMVEGDKLTLKLVKREITWGDYNQQCLELTQDTREKVRPIIQQMKYHLVAQHQNELAQRQLFAQALVQWAQCRQAGVSFKNCVRQ
jgi:hypothetical protein